MIDFGLGSFFQEVEKRIGPKWAILCTFIAMAAFVAFCLSSVWTLFVGPVFAAIVDFYYGQASFLNSVWEIVKRIVWFGLVVVVTTNMMNIASIARARRETEATLDKVADLAKEMNANKPYLDASNKILNKEHALLKALVNLTEKLVDLNRSTKSKVLKTEIRKIADILEADMPEIQNLKDDSISLLDAAEESSMKGERAL